jgi:microcystin-dependent protein
VPVHAGQGPGISNTYILGESGGVETVTLSPQQMPSHSHPFLASTDNASAVNPQNNVLATTNVSKRVYAAGSAPASGMAPQSITLTGGSQPHENMQPFLCVNFIISLFGIFPSPT